MHEEALLLGLFGAAVTGLDKHEEVEPLLIEGYAEMNPPPASAYRKNEALERIVKLYESWGKKDEAAPWRKKLETAEAAARKPAAKGKR